MSVLARNRGGSRCHTHGRDRVAGQNRRPSARSTSRYKRKHREFPRSTRGQLHGSSARPPVRRERRAREPRRGRQGTEVPPVFSPAARGYPGTNEPTAACNASGVLHQERSRFIDNARSWARSRDRHHHHRRRRRRRRCKEVSKHFLPFSRSPRSRRSQLMTRVSTFAIIPPFSFPPPQAEVEGKGDPP